MSFIWPADRNSEVEISDGARVIWRKKTNTPRVLGRKIELVALARGWELQHKSSPRDLRDDVQLIEYIFVKTIGNEVQRRFLEVIYPVSPLTWTGAL